MLDKISKYSKSKKEKYPYSIIIPTWNNKDYLANCIEGIQAHSKYDAQIIVFINEGKDGTLDWLEESAFEHVDYIYSEHNAGICFGVNLCRTLVKSDYMVYMNDDMFPLPNWDEALFKEINQLKTKMFLLSATMVEPFETGNPCVVVKDFGDSLETFQKEAVVAATGSMERDDWQGSTWPPTIVSTELWDLVGGLSIEYSPGFYSDPDFSFKLMVAGVRIFKGVGNSLVYHFGSKSTKRVKMNKGRSMFIQKWGISSGIFTQDILKSGSKYQGETAALDAQLKDKLKHRIKRMIHC